MTATGIKEWPMLLSGHWVRAIREGRKTQTRRPIKPQPEETPHGFRFPGGIRNARQRGRYFVDNSEKQPWIHDCCPLGRPGDRLWVRETWALVRPWFDPESGIVEDVTEWEGPLPDSLPDRWVVWYAADGDDIKSHRDDRLVKRWRPSIHMPRWASRIDLENARVRVERLQDLNDADAIAEGIESKGVAPDGKPLWNVYGLESLGQVTSNAIWSYERAWDQTYPEQPWRANPWVWFVEFRRIESEAAA